MEKLDGVFDGENVFPFVVINKVDDCRKGCRLSASGRSRDKDKAFFQGSQVFKHFGKIELIKGGYLGGDGPEDR